MMDKKKLYKVIIIMSIVGLITSLYLLYNHYQSVEKGSVCDFSAKISCSLVNTSKYAEIFNVPAALLGALWFLFTILIVQKAKKNDHYTVTLLYWSILGIFSILYFVYAEIVLQSICPFCTIAHILIIIIFILSIILYQNLNKKPTFSSPIKTTKYLIITSAVGVAIIFMLFNLPQQEKENYDSLAKCLTEKGVVMYGSFKCSHCLREKDLFGSSFQYIDYVECHPQGLNPQTQHCTTKQITLTPTWTVEKDGIETKRQTGFMDIASLKEFGGCQ